MFNDGEGDKSAWLRSLASEVWPARWIARSFLGATLEFHPCSELNFCFDYDLQQLSKDEFSMKLLIHLKGSRTILLDHLCELQNRCDFHRLSI